MPAQCRSCPAPVMWANHVETRRANPLDAEPSPEGNCEVRRGLHSTKLYYKGSHEVKTVTAGASAAVLTTLDKGYRACD